MHDKVRVSVCMAAYNGEKYIEEQIASILPELGTSDEVIVIDDCSTDSTVAVVEALGDPRIRLIRNERNLGYVRTFERALTESSGDYVFLSDQDDVWIPGRVETMIAQLQTSRVVVSNCNHFGAAAGRFHDIRLRAADSTRHAANILGIIVGYRLHWGCAMAFRSDLKDVVLPFPHYMRESHDQWIAMGGNVARSISYLEEDTILHRLHGDNLTPGGVRGIKKILEARLAFMRNLGLLIMRTAAPRTRQAPRHYS